MAVELWFWFPNILASIELRFPNDLYFLGTKLNFRCFCGMTNVKKYSISTAFIAIVAVSAATPVYAKSDCSRSSSLVTDVQSMSIDGCLEIRFNAHNQEKNLRLSKPELSIQVEKPATGIENVEIHQVINDQIDDIASARFGLTPDSEVYFGVLDADDNDYKLNYRRGIYPVGRKSASMKVDAGFGFKQQF